MKYILSIVLIALTACVHQPRQDMQLYRDLGELDGITRIVDDFLFQLAEDDSIIHHFEDTDIDRFREKLIEQICNLSGGPCEYTGDSMKVSHAGMDITTGQFNSLVEDLIVAMENEHIPTATQNGLLAQLAPMYDEIMRRGDFSE